MNVVICCSTAVTQLNLACSPQMVNPENPSLNLQVAIKNTATNTVFYFTAPIAMEALMASTPAMDTQALAGAWKSLDDSMEVSVVVNGTCSLVIVALYNVCQIFQLFK